MLPELGATRIVESNGVEVIGKGDGVFLGGYELLEEHRLVQVRHLGRIACRDAGRLVDAFGECRRDAVPVWLPAAPDNREPCKIVLPAQRVPGAFALRQTRVHDADSTPASFWSKGDLERAGRRWEGLRASASPRDDQPMRWVEFDVATLDRPLTEEHGELSPGAGVKNSVVAQPADERLRLGEVPEDKTRICRDVDRVSIGLSGRRQPRPPPSDASTRLATGQRGIGRGSRGPLG